MRVAIFASGNGSNVEAILKANKNNELEIEVPVILTNNPDAKVVDVALFNCVNILFTTYHNRRGLTETKYILQILEEFKIDMIVLAGYLKLIDKEIIDHVDGKIINIHPGPLKYGGKGMYGKKVHEKVLNDGLDETCVTIHYVNEEYDKGSTIACYPIKILKDDTVDSLNKRVLKEEHKVYPPMIKALAKLTENGFV